MSSNLEIKTWDIRYGSETKVSLRTSGTYEKAERIAKKNNRFNEAFEITEAPKENLELEKELALQEAIKYGCSTKGMN